MKYIHDIRDFRHFTDEVIFEINNLPPDERLIILLTYNEIMKILALNLLKI